MIFGVNFIPTREGSRTLIKVLQRESREFKKPTLNKDFPSNASNGEKKPIARNIIGRRKYLYIQAWRWYCMHLLKHYVMVAVCMYACIYSHQLCSDSIPGHLFPRADDVLVQAYSLVRTKVFNDWERWNFVEIILRWVCM